MTRHLDAKLLSDTLPSGLSSPAYDPKLLGTSIVHIGAAGFHRAHQQDYIDRYLAKTGDLAWGICSSGIREDDRALQEALKSQDCLYTLIERVDEKIDARIMGSMTDYILGQDDAEAFVQKLADPETKIISLTITAAGYYIDERNSGLNIEHPDILHDLKKPETPKTIFGYLSRSLRHRMQNGTPPCTIMSCDNIQGNGKITEKALLAFCDEVDPELSTWIKHNVAFPDSMVDRITPYPSEETNTFVRERFGIEDRCAVMCEPYIQWVVEDEFAAGRPALEQVGVQFTTDVAPYEKIKLRVLNACHSLIAYLGYSAGHEYIYEIVRDPLFEQYARLYLNEEVTPHLDPVPGVNLTEYKARVISRFGNAAIEDKALRICADGSYKFPKFILPTVRDQLKVGGSIKLASLSVAAWMHFLHQAVEKRTENTVRDPMVDTLLEKARKGGGAEAFLDLREVFGDLSDNDRFRTEVRAHFEGLQSGGALATLRDCVRGT